MNTVKNNFLKYVLLHILLLHILLLFSIESIANNNITDTAKKDSAKVDNEKQAVFKDSTDNAFDLSYFLTTKKGVLPIPNIITEPAIGYGGMLGLAYFHSSIMEKGNIPDITGVFGGGTENGTWGAGIYHAGYWKEDRIRYTGVLVRTNANYDYYGPNQILDNAVNMNLDTWIILQQLIFRIKSSNLFVGGRYFFYDGNNTLDIPIDIPQFTGKEFKSVISEISAIVNYDTRNNVFSPSKGIYVQLNGAYSDKWLGGDDQYSKFQGRFLGFGEINKKTNLGTRVEVNYASENNPFWRLPSIDMRGVPIAKYQGNKTALLEMQLDYNVYKRWNLSVFTGMGTTQSLSESILQNGNTVHTVGTGFRYLIARVFGLQGGMDFAWSNDDFAFYFTVGHAWNR